MESGTKLGHFEIGTLLGKGGIGEVWRAPDTKLGREVAIKTLPEEFAKDAERIVRFEREAKLPAASKAFCFNTGRALWRSWESLFLSIGLTDHRNLQTL